MMDFMYFIGFPETDPTDHGGQHLAASDSIDFRLACAAELQ